MPQRTVLFNQLPWIGGVNTSLDESMIPPNQLVRADNVVYGTRGSKLRKEGINYNWDDQPTTARSIYGLHEFWFGLETRVRRLVSVDDTGEVKSYLVGGIGSIVPVGGRPWTGTIDDVSLLTYNNRCIIAVNGADNTIKVWDGISDIEDLRNASNQILAASGRASSGTTRTLILSTAFLGVAGDIVIVHDATGPNASFYNGTYVVNSVTTSNIANDTITYTGVGSLAEAATSDATLIVDGAAPLGSIVRLHQDRIWTNDKTNRDRLNYSSPFNHLEWLGVGDSGAIDIGIGDGDPEGIVAIFPTFKGELFVAKKTKLYRISGSTPETYSVSLVSNGIGCVSHNAVALIDQDEMMFISERGIHSMHAVQYFGDFQSNFVSLDIQKTFIEQFPKSRLKYARAAYNPEINSVAFSFTDSNIPDLVNSTLEDNNSVWLYNIEYKAWYRWADVPAQSLILASDGDRRRFYYGTNKGRIAQDQTGNLYNIDYDGNQQDFNMTITTGQISPDQNFYTNKGFKRVFLYYKPYTDHNINISVKIDGKAVPASNVVIFSEDPIGDHLGDTFILGESQLGGDLKLGGYNSTISGYGKSFKLELSFGGINKKVDIQGFGIELEMQGVSPKI